MTKKLLGILTAVASVAIAGVALAEVPAACTGITFTRNLAQGMSGADVKCLQALLNQDPATQVAASGPGSPGNETTYFGPLTRAAVVKFQEKYAADILAPLGLTAGTGYVGPLTRAKLNSLLTAAPAPTPTPTPTPTPAQPPAEEVGEEGTLTVKVATTPYNVTVKEGEQNVAVTAFTLTAKDSAIRVERIDIAFTNVPGGNKIYKILNYASLYDGANAIKGVSLSKDTVTTEDSAQKVRFSGLGLTIPKGESKTITLKVSAVSTLPATGTVKVMIPKEGIRGVDTAGIQHLIADEEVTLKPFTVDKAAVPSLKITLASDTPKEGVAIVSQTEDIEIDLARYTLKMENADGKITGLSTVVDGATSSIVEIRVYDGSTMICAESITGVTSTCSDLEIPMAKDTSKTLTVKALVTKNTNAKDVNVSNLVATYEDAEENSYTVSAGTPGNTIHLYTVAPIISNITASAEAKDLDNSGGPEAIVGKITFSVTARGGDVWISKDKSDLAVKAISSSDNSQNVSNVVLTTSVTAGNWGYKVPQDQTISFTVDATYSPDSAGYWKLAITQLVWDVDDEPSTIAQTWTGWAVKDLVTGYVYLVGQ
jgi:peptidoglycan hydrolase-like protein with peptidoglycan-binding domain